MPSRQPPSVVSPRVSAETSTEKSSSPKATTVRQQPEQAMEAPRATLERPGQSGGKPMVKRASLPPPIGVTARTVPRPVIRPVNIRPPF